MDVTLFFSASSPGSLQEGVEDDPAASQWWIIAPAFSHLTTLAENRFFGITTTVVVVAARAVEG
jgi:hypothetical protein